MKVPPKRSILPIGKRLASKRIRTSSERADANMGGTERDVVPLTPPSAEANTSKPGTAASQLDPGEELTPG